MKLSNTDTDKLNLLSRLNKEKSVPAIISLGFFSSAPKVMSFTTADYNGFITNIDMNSGYVEWTDDKGLRMPVVNINSIELLSEIE